MDESNARQVTEAIYANGVLKPVEGLHLGEKERVRLIVERLPSGSADRDALLAKLRSGIESMSFRSRGSYPSREELHAADDDGH